MVKPALGKGMKDLIAKNFGMVDQKDPSKDLNTAREELKVNISRYRAQGLNVEPLKRLEGRGAEDIAKGIERYRSAVKVLNTAQTILRSLQGYGYNKEIDSINENIRDPAKAMEVLKAVKELKERAQTEHNIRSRDPSSPGSKLSESLREKSQMLKGEGPTEDSDEIDEDALDDLLDDLMEIGEAFSLEAEDDPILVKIADWEETGYFVDGLKNSLAEDRERAGSEVEQFEKEVTRMEEIKSRFSEMDLTGFQKEAREIRVKFQYPHLAKEIENELNRIESMKKEAERFMGEGSPGEEAAEETGEDAREEAPKEKGEFPQEEVTEDIEEVPGIEEASAPERTEDQIPGTGEASAPEVTEEDIPDAEEIPEADDIPVAETVVEEEGEAPEDGSEEEATSLSPEELMERAKEAYKEGRLEESLTLFKELLRADPDSSKARFMIRRISSKLG